MVFKRWISVFLFCVFMMASGALAEFDAEIAKEWLSGFSKTLAAYQMQNDALTTADPARPGEYLLEYNFGTVLSMNARHPSQGEILRVELTTPDLADCRGVRVGQTLEDVIAGREIALSDTPLYVLSTQEYGYGWSWVYVGGSEVYGVEYISYSDDEAAMKEYTLTYVIAQGRITAIRLRIADATQAQAIEGMKTAEEIAARQFGEVVISENSQPELINSDLTVNSRLAVGVPVEALIAMIGEPNEIQTLPSGAGRLLIYDQMIVELIFDEMTGVELVRSVGCTSAAFAGPRGIRVGITLREAAERFRCDGSVHSTGGVVYLAGEAQGIAPYGEMISGSDGVSTLRYACVAQNGATGILDIVADDGVVTSWNLYYEKTEAAYGG